MSLILILTGFLATTPTTSVSGIELLEVQCPEVPANLDVSCFDRQDCSQLEYQLALTASCYSTRYAQCKEHLDLQKRILGIKVAIPTLPPTEDSYPIVKYIAGGLIVLTGGIAIGYALGQ